MSKIQEFLNTEWGRTLAAIQEAELRAKKASADHKSRELKRKIRNIFAYLVAVIAAALAAVATVWFAIACLPLTPEPVKIGFIAGILSILVRLALFALMILGPWPVFGVVFKIVAKGLIDNRQPPRLES